MGQQESTNQNIEFWKEFKQKYSFFQEINDKRFGEIHIFKHKIDDKFIAKRSHMCNSSEDYKYFMQQCKHRQHFQHKNILILYSTLDASQDQICGDFNKVTIYFEFYFHDLDQEMQRRREKKEFLTEQELWYILNSLVSAGHFLEKHQIYHGDIRPVNILLTSEGYVKIADHGIIHVDQTNYFKMISGKSKCYLSPSLMLSLKQQDLKPIHDFWKSDVYSLGMTLLEIATLCSPMICYDWLQLNISQHSIDELLVSARLRYSDFLIGLIKDMLLEDEASRPCFEDLHALLMPYQEKIQNFEAVVPQTQQLSNIYQNLASHPASVPINQSSQSAIQHIYTQQPTPIVRTSFIQSNQPYTPPPKYSPQQFRNIQSYAPSVNAFNPSCVQQVVTQYAMPQSLSASQRINNKSPFRLQRPQQAIQIQYQQPRQENQRTQYQFPVYAQPDDQTNQIKQEQYERQEQIGNLDLSEIDRKVNEAIKNSEETIRKHSEQQSQFTSLQQMQLQQQATAEQNYTMQNQMSFKNLSQNDNQQQGFQGNLDQLPTFQSGKIQFTHQNQQQQSPIRYVNNQSQQPQAFAYKNQYIIQ